MRKEHIEQLQLFIHLAESLHFGKTAAAFFISTPTLSRQISLLEEGLGGGKLFRRTKRSVSLTPAGEYYLSYAKELCSAHDTLLQNIRALRDEVCGTVTIAASATAAYGILSHRLEGFREQYPYVTVNLKIVEVGGIFKTLREGACDIALTSKKSVPKGIVEQVLTSIEYAIVGPKKWSKKQVDVHKDTFIIPHAGDIRDDILDWFYQQDIEPNLYDDSQGFEGILVLASLGYGLGIVPKMVLQESRLGSELAILSPPSPLPILEASLFAKSTTLKQAAVSAFWRYLT